jgi:hypothetical protein
MTGSARRVPGAVNRRFGHSSREIPIDERDSISPDDEAEHEQWLRDNTPPHHS